MCDIAAMKCNAKKHPRLRLLALPLVLECWSPAPFARHVIPRRGDSVTTVFAGLVPADFAKYATPNLRGAVRRTAAAGEAWRCQPGGINRELRACFQENMQADAVPLLKDYDTYAASLPVRERGISKPLKLYQLQFYVKESDLDTFAARMDADEQRPTVAYIAAASHSGKSASVLVGFLRAREQSTVEGQCAMNFTHYLYMPFANNGGNFHSRVSDAKVKKACSDDVELREALGASYMRDCFKAQAFGQRFRFLRRLLRLHCEPTRYLQDWKPALRNFNTTQKLLQKDSPPSCSATQVARCWCT